MAKGQQRSNREAKKPKKAKIPVAPASSSSTTNGKKSAFIPTRKT